MQFLVYTDGSCSPNPGSGGWAAVIKSPDADVTELHGHVTHTTNNRMELTAAIEALQFIPAGATVKVSSDSTYVVRSCPAVLRRGVRPKRPNPDLWAALIEAVRRHKSVGWVWVRGHNGHTGNERAHALANKSRVSGCARQQYAHP